MRKTQFPLPREGEANAELSSHDRILQAGRDLFAEDGYENTTTSAIARRAGTSESQLIKHFGSKEGLLEGIFDRAWQRMAQGVQHVQEGDAPPLERLRALTELMIASLERDKELRTLMLLEGRRIRKHGHMVLMTRGFQAGAGGAGRHRCGRCRRRESCGRTSTRRRCAPPWSAPSRGCCATSS